MRVRREWLAGAVVVAVIALAVWPWGARVYLSHQGDNVPVVVIAGGRELYRDVLGCTREVEPGVFQTTSSCILRLDAALSPLVPLTVQAGKPPPCGGCSSPASRTSSSASGPATRSWSSGLTSRASCEPGATASRRAGDRARAGPCRRARRRAGRRGGTSRAAR